MDIAIIIPAYNEEQTIKEMIHEFHNEVKKASIYVIDNNSSDQTYKIAQDTFKKLKCKGGVLSEKRQGKANAIRKAFYEINADIYVMVDADLTYPASDLPKLLEPVINGEVDMCIGDRLSQGDYFNENKRPMHNFGNRIVLKLINILFKSNLNDIMTGYRVFNKKFIKNLPILSGGFELETEMTLHALDKRFAIKEVPIKYKDRQEGSVSKLNTISDGFKVLKTIFKIFKDFRPLAFFSIGAFFFFAGGIASGTPVILEFIKTQYITHVPLAILATGCMIFSLIFMTIGLILDTIVKHFKINFEQQVTLFSQLNK